MLEFQETGVDPGWINNGGLFIANNKERMEEYRRLYTMGKVLGIESHLLSPEETKVDMKPLFQKRDSFPKAQGSEDQGSCGLVSHVFCCTAEKFICSVSKFLLNAHFFSVSTLS